MRLHDVLQEIEQILGVPGKRSAELRGTPTEATPAGKQAVIYLARAAHPVAKVFEELEELYDLRFTADPLQWQVETMEEYRQRHRRLRQVDLRRYGAGMIISDEASKYRLGITGMVQRGSGGFDLYSDEGFGGGFNGSEISWGRVLEYARAMIEGEIGEGDAVVFASLTDDEFTALNEMLERRLLRSLRQQHWSVQAGILPQGAGSLATGLLDAGMIATVSERLQELHRAELSGLHGQQVVSELALGRQRTTDYDVGGEDHQDPVVDSTHAGLTVELTGLQGWRGRYLDLSVDWAERLASAELATGPRLLREQLSDTQELSLDGSIKGDGDEDETIDLSGDGTSSGPTRQLQVTGMQHCEDWWSWRPHMQVLIPESSGLVVSAPHPRGTAVLIIQPVLEEDQP